MASPAFQAVGAVNTTSTLSPAATCPVTTTTGRGIIWCFFGQASNYTAVTPPTGFTARIDTTVGTTSVVRVCVATKNVVGVSGDSGATFTGSATGGAGSSGKFILVYDQFDPAFAGTWPTAAANQGTMSTTSVVMNAITTTVADATILGFFLDMSTAVANRFTADALMVERQDASANVSSLEVADEARPTTGSTGTRTAVPATSTANWGTIGFQLPPTPAAGGATSLIFERVSSLHRTLRSM